jgi:hypothetical protein
MKVSKKIIIAVAILLVVAFFVYWNNPSNVYSREISQLRQNVSENNQNAIKNSLSHVSAGGEWGDLEKAVKDYVRNRRESLASLKQLQGDDDLITALDAEQLEKNAPHFETILAKLKTAKDELSSARSKYHTVQSIDNAVDELGSALNDEFKARYRSELENVFADEDSRVNNADAFKMLQGMVETYIAELELLSKNPDAWKIKDKAIHFSDKSVKKQYEKILDDVKNIQ